MKMAMFTSNSFVVSRNETACIHYLLEQGADPRLGPPLRKAGPDGNNRPVLESPQVLNFAAAWYTPETLRVLYRSTTPLDTDDHSIASR